MWIIPWFYGWVSIFLGVPILLNIHNYLYASALKETEEWTYANDEYSRVDPRKLLVLIDRQISWARLWEIGWFIHGFSCLLITWFFAKHWSNKIGEYHQDYAGICSTMDLYPEHKDNPNVIDSHSVINCPWCSEAWWYDPAYTIQLKGDSKGDSSEYQKNLEDKIKAFE